MFGNRKRKIRTTDEELNILNKNNKVILISYVLATFCDVSVSLTVFKYAKEFFLNNESGFLARFSIIYYRADDFTMFWLSIAANVAIFFFILFVGKLYILYYIKHIKEGKAKFTKLNFMSANLINLAIFMCAYFHLIGALSWLVS